MEAGMEGALRGDVCKMEQPKDHVVWLYLISTNGDMDTEKEALYTDVFPKIEKICQEKGLVLQVVEHQPYTYCSWPELCNNSAGVFMLSLLGEKQAARSLPLAINAKEFSVLMRTGEELLESLQASESEEKLSIPQKPDLQDLQFTLDFLRNNYRKDENSVPPCYICHSGQERAFSKKDSCDSTSKQVAGISTLNQVLGCVQILLKRAHVAGKISTEAILKYLYPAMDCLVKFRNRHPSSSLTVRRRFYDRNQTSDAIPEAEQKYFDSRPMGSNTDQTLDDERYMEELEKAVVCQGSLSYEVSWKRSGLNAGIQEHSEYLEKMCTEVREKLVRVLNSQVTLCKKPGDDLLREIQNHSQTCQRICKSFCGQNDVLSRINQLLQKQKLQVIVHGAPGSGKTFLCAKIVELFSEFHGSSCVKLCRFYKSSGTNFVTLRHALLNLCRQLCRIVHTGSEEEIATVGRLSDVTEMIEYLLYNLPSLKIPCLIVLDGIEDFQSIRLLVGGLLENLPSHVSFVLSMPSNLKNDMTDSDESDKMASIQLLGLENQEKNISGNDDQFSPHVIDLRPQIQSAYVIIMNKLLKDNNRRLTAYQRDQVLSIVRRCPNPIFLKVFTKLTCSWLSYQNEKELNKVSEVTSALGVFFDNLETAYGKEFVRLSMQYLTLSKCGLSESDLIALLRADSVAVNVLHQRYVPAMVNRVISDIRYILSEQHDGHAWLYTWAHSTITEFVKNRYLDKSSMLNIYSSLANYWLRIFEDTQSSFEEMGDSVQGTSGREQCDQLCDELPYCLIHSKRRDKIVEVLLSVEWIYLKLKIRSPLALIDDFVVAEKVLPNEGYESVVDAAALGLGSSKVAVFVTQLLSHSRPHCSNFPETVGRLCERITTWLLRQPGNSYVLCVAPQCSSHPPWKQLTLGGGHVCVSTDTYEIVTVTDKGFVVLYDLLTAKPKKMKRLKRVDSSWETIQFANIYQQTDGKRCIAVYEESSVSLFDLKSWRHVSTIHYPASSSPVFSPDFRYYASHTRENGLTIQDTSVGEEILNCEGVVQQKHLVFSEDGRYEIFQRIKGTSGGLHQCVVKILNTATRTVTALTEVALPSGFQVVANTFQLQGALIGIVKTSAVPSILADVPDDLQRVQSFHLSTSCRSLDIKLPVLASYIRCDKHGDYFIAGNEDSAFIYRLPEGSMSCEIKKPRSKDVILGGHVAVFYSGSVVQVFSSVSGDLIARWTSFSSPADRFWVSSDDSMLVKHAAVENGGKLLTWDLSSVSKPGTELDRTVNCVHYNRQKGIITGIATEGHILTMDTFRSALRWRLGTVRINDRVNRLVCSVDGSLVALVGTKLTLVDVAQEEILICKDVVSDNNGRLLDCCISLDNKSLTLVETNLCGNDILHYINLSGAEQTVSYKCIPGSIRLGHKKVLYWVKDESRGPQDGYLELMHLTGDKHCQILNIEIHGQKISTTCFNSEETQLAVVSSNPQSSGNSPVILKVTLFDADNLTTLGTFAKEVDQCDVKKAILLKEHVIVINKCNVLKLNSISGEFCQVFDSVLTNPVVSEDERYLVALTEGPGVPELLVLNISSSDILLKQQLSPEIPREFMSSGNLDTLFFFVRGMAHPSVFIANESMRHALKLDQKSCLVPFHSMASCDASEPPVAIQSVSRLLLTEGPRKPTELDEPLTSEKNDHDINTYEIRKQETRVFRDKSRRFEHRAYFSRTKPTTPPVSQEVLFSNSFGAPMPCETNPETEISPLGVRQFQNAVENWTNEAKHPSVDSVTTAPRAAPDDSGSDFTGSSSGDTDSSESESGSYSDSDSLGSEYTSSDAETSADTTADRGRPDSVDKSPERINAVKTNGVVKDVDIGDNPHCNSGTDVTEQVDESFKSGDIIFHSETIPKKSGHSEKLLQPDTLPLKAADVSVTSGELSGLTANDNRPGSWNYFASSESEHEYDSGAEDTETDSCGVGKTQPAVRGDNSKRGSGDPTDYTSASTPCGARIHSVGFQPC